MNWEKELERRKIDDGKRGLFAAKWKDKKTEALAQRERMRERERERERDEQRGKHNRNIFSSCIRRCRKTGYVH